MTIPKEVLERWSNIGATETPKRLREKIERILVGNDSAIQRKESLDIYLQGSYRNKTNIYGNSDVDVVVQHNATYYSDTTRLTPSEKDLYDDSFIPATYQWETFKYEVIVTLQKAFGKSNVEIGNKSIKIDDGSYEADVVPCFEYRKYYSFSKSASEQDYIQGIRFLATEEERRVINFPKEHYSNGAYKNQLANSHYKPTIRIFKNIKKKLIEKGMLSKEEASSYFIENLLFNVPNQSFTDINAQTRVFNNLQWLHRNSDENSLSELICQNKQEYLFGHSEEQWNIGNAQKFVSKTIELWNEW